MGLLPYWDRNIDLEILPWMPYRLDFNPVSSSTAYSEQLGDIASMAFEMDSELLYLESIETGQTGSLFREHLVIPGSHSGEEKGFSIVFGYSAVMEALLGMFAKAYPGLMAGLAICGVWDRAMLVEECKVIVMVGEHVLFNGEQCLSALRDVLNTTAGSGGLCGFYAEKFGYRRFSIPYETDNVTQLSIARVLYDFELEETRKVVGPPPEVEFPESGFGDISR
ncbi:MAG: hypothetical protein U9R40_07815 [Synergistota bacterium]|nr:hypothetical protein [Synergistota bacterium]